MKKLLGFTLVFIGINVGLLFPQLTLGEEVSEDSSLNSLSNDFEQISTTNTLDSTEVSEPINSTEETTNTSSQKIDKSLDSTTIETSDTFASFSEHFNVLTPEKYGLLSAQKVSYYASAVDAISLENPLLASKDQFIKLIAYQQLDSGNILYHFIANDGKEGYVFDKDINRNESTNFITLPINITDIKIFNDLNLSVSVPYDSIKGRTYRIQEEISLNNKTYLSLLNSKNNFIGFIEKGLLQETSQITGTPNTHSFYVNINDFNQHIYSDITFSKKTSSATLKNQTLLTKEIFYHYDGENYVSLFDNKNNLKGYINEKYLTKSSAHQGTSQKYNKYVVLTKKDYILWNNFKWEQKDKAGKYSNKTLMAKDIFYHFNGSKYLSIYDNKNQWLGYINADATKEVAGPQGDYQTYNKYITIKTNNYSIWTNFNWLLRDTSSKIAGKTYLARGIYYHFNGEKYLSIYDNKGKWIGYMNEKGATISKGQEGIYQPFNKYVSVTTTGYSIWNNFNWKQKSTTKSYKNNTLLAKGVYHHYNGESYYSMYNNKNQWVGYVNKKGVTVADGAQGIYHPYGKNITFSNANYTVWKNFKWQKQTNGISVKGKTIMAKGIYYHHNGSSYFSLYQGKNWVGYINSDASQKYDMNKLIPNNESLFAVHKIVQQKILDTSKKPNSIIDQVLNLSTINRNQITYRDNNFVVSLKGKNVGMDEVKLTPKEIAPAVNYNLLPADQIKGAIPKLNKNKKYVALTFDDGPNARTTPQLLNTLKQKKVKATFFMLGNSVNANPNLAKRVANEGHQIGSHSYSHPQLTSLSSTQVTNQMKQTDKAIYFATGKLPKTFRPPYGAINRAVSNTVAKPAIMWSIDTRDWESRNPTAINNVVNQNIHNGAIILLHDIHQASVDSVPTMIDNLKRKGYEFVTVDELLEMNHRPFHGYFSRTNNRGY